MARHRELRTVWVVAIFFVIFFFNADALSNRDTVRSLRGAKTFLRGANSAGFSNLKSNEFRKSNSGFIPGQKADNFSLPTLNGTVLYPSDTFKSSPIFFVLYINQSGFEDCLFNSDDSLRSLVNSGSQSHFIFMFDDFRAAELAVWLQMSLRSLITSGAGWQVFSRLHFVSISSYKLQSWIPLVFSNWQCQDHNCGLDQIMIMPKDASPSLFPLMRLDARYDWLPSPSSLFANRTLDFVTIGYACDADPRASGKIVIARSGLCDSYTKVLAMYQSGALGMLLMTAPGEHLFDFNCIGSQCDTPINISVSIIPFEEMIASFSTGTLTFITEPSDNFFFAIDPFGQLAETGWGLYPTFQFLVWQDQWFTFMTKLIQKINDHPPDTVVVSVFENAFLQGKDGITKNLTIPNGYNRMELDLSLSCPGTRDGDCAMWDRVLNLFVCCEGLEQQCGQELGRWITPFRRRIGRWLTDVSALLPLVAGRFCSLNMKTDAWAMPWMPSLSVRFYNAPEDLFPVYIQPLFNGGTFDKSYNTKYQPIPFTVPSGIKKVILAATITGHGSDDQQCAEFCPTTHVFMANGANYSVSFNDAGTPLGCANRVLDGVVPNEHGTWLYGRDGWCDGLQVDPLIFDITSVIAFDKQNSVNYRGLFQGKDPNPQHDPGVIIMNSYLVYFK